MILTELNRIASHLLWLGTHALDIGAITPVFYCLREREEALKIFENYCGARLTTHAFRIGGLQYETYDGFEQECQAFCDMFIPKVDEYEELLTNNRIWVSRLKGVGILNADECKEYGVTGPVLRAAGVKWDLRKAQPYSGYEQYDFEIPDARRTATPTTGTWSAWKRCASRCASSGRRWTRFPTARSWARSPKVIKPPMGEAYVSIEAPKGELGYYIVSDDSTQPYRMRVRPPSFINLQALDRMVRGGLVADWWPSSVRWISCWERSIGNMMSSFLRTDLPGGSVPGPLGHVPQSESEIHLYRAVSGGAAEGGRALPRRAAAEHQSGQRRDALHRVQPVRARLPGKSDRGHQRAQRSHAPQGTDHLHVRHFPLHVLRAVRRRLPGGRAGADAGFRAGHATPAKARSGTGRCSRKGPSPRNTNADRHRSCSTSSPCWCWAAPS